MSVRRVLSLSRVLLAFVVWAIAVESAKAQEHTGHSQQTPDPDSFPTREASGTSWLPESSPMYGIHHAAGDWQLMWHGNAFAQFLYESADRGNEQSGSINSVMAWPGAGSGAGGSGFAVCSASNH